MKSCRYFYGRLPLVVSETNDTDYIEDPQTISLQAKGEWKQQINYRSKYRRNVGRKNADEDEDNKKNTKSGGVTGNSSAKK